MTLLIVMMSVLSALALGSLYFTHKNFHRLELLTYFMVVVIMIQQVFLILTLNLDMIKPSREIPVVWFHNINLLLFIPSLTLWLLYSYFSPAITLFVKALLTGGWFLCMYGIELLFHFAGMYTFIRWNIGYSFIEWLIVLGGSNGFALWFRKLLRKQETS